MVMVVSLKALKLGKLIAVRSTKFPATSTIAHRNFPDGTPITNEELAPICGPHGGRVHVFVEPRKWAGWKNIDLFVPS
jgi:hypothetical protein